jgi:very-short-patch-repair endonuclease
MSETRQPITHPTEQTSQNPLAISVDYAGFLSYAVHQNDVPLIQQITLVNQTDQAIGNLTIEVSLQSGHCMPWQCRVEMIAPNGTHRLDQVHMELDPAKLASQYEREKTQLVVSVSNAQGQLQRWTGTLDVLAFNEWHGSGSLIELTAAYILPNHPQVQQILSNASKILRKSVPGAALDGYQSGSSQRVIDIAYAIYTAIGQLQISYINPPASFENTGQKVRFPDDMVSHQLGTCLDLSMLFAACLEQAGLYPLLVIIQGHAFVGVWMHDTHYAYATMDEPTSLSKRVDLREITLFEATMLTHDPVPTLDRCMAAGRAKLAEPEKFICALDVKSARTLMIRPLPSRTVIDGKVVVEVQGEKTQDVAAIPQVQEFQSQRDQASKQQTDEDVETPSARIERWKRKLLDLSLRNRVLNYNRNSKRAVPIFGNMLAQLEDMLAAGKSFRFYSMHNLSELSQLRAQAQKSLYSDDLVENFMQDMFEHRYLPADLSQQELDSRLLELLRTTRSEVEESGISTLYLALGMLKWYETPTSDKPRYAPILLLPVTLTRTSASAPFTLTQSDDDPHINVTLMQKLKEFGLEEPGLDELLLDDSGLDIPGIMGRFRALIVDVPRWDIIEEAHLGMFSFTKFLMWNDLEQRSNALLRNYTVRHLVDRPDEAFDDGAPFPDPAELDQKRDPVHTYCPLDADSSQLSAIFAAHDGKSFVLEGPPGTGKSQTITNLIAHCLGHGKRVLFVAEKQAALNVVHQRLSNVGLGPFTLELHSHKANKRQVLDQLQEALNVAGSDHHLPWDKHCSDLLQTRQAINDLVHAMHRRRKIGMSVFTGLSRLMALPSQLSLEMTINDPVNLAQEQYDHWLRITEELTNASRLVFPINEHPLCGIISQNWTPTLAQEITRLCEPLEHATARMIESFEAFRQVLGLELKEQPSLYTVNWLVKAGQLLQANPNVSANLIAVENWQQTSETLRKTIELGRKRNELRQKYLSVFQPEIMSQPLVEWLGQYNQSVNQWFLPRTLTQRKIRKQVSLYLQPSQSFDSAELFATLTALLELKRLDEQLRDPNHPAAIVFESHWQKGDPNWDQLDAQIHWMDRLVKRLGELLQTTFAESASQTLRQFAEHSEQKLVTASESGKALSALLEHLASLAKALELLEKSGHFDMRRFTGQPNKPDMLRVILHASQRYPKYVDQLNDWCYWQRVRVAAIDSELSNLIKQHEQGMISTEMIKPALQRAVLDTWINATWKNEPVLNRLNIHEHVQRIEHFKQLDTAHLKLSQLKVRHALSESVPSQQIAANLSSSEMGLLAHQLKLKRRHMSVRKLISKLPNLLPRLKPCLLMSPLSVAQYLDADYPPFDVVIFDEASQIPVWDAVGAIARGSQVIVVGDSKQLPPTNFFARQDTIEEDDDEQLEDLESILDECAAAGMPSRKLLWHYRSRHESLIAFSNYHYYNNHLFTFPNAIDESDKLGVSLRHIADGVYDRSKARNNMAEAKAIVQEVMTRLLNPEQFQTSIGIVTFSMAQQILVEDLLDDARREHPQVEPYFNPDYPDHVFVKNLENVQGDERSVILFSICYARDLNGKMAMNFGPLNREGGERRLNVAITRAREQVVVFSSILADDIDLSRSNKLGVRHLKVFLDYAKRGVDAISQAHQIDHDADCESPFEKQVMDRLAERGWQVVPQVGCSGYRIDLGVKYPEKPGRFVLGIECDGATYHSAKTARDRDRLRQSVLEHLGWTMHRVWSTQWWVNPQHEIELIEQAIKQAMEKTQTATEELHVAPQPTPDQWQDQDDPELVHDQGANLLAGHATIEETQAQIQPTALPKGAVFYDCFTQGKRLGDADVFYQDDPKLAELILAILKIEAPMSLRLLAKRVMPLYDMGRQTKRVDDRLAYLLRRLANQVQVIGSEVWLCEQNPDEYAGFRIPQGDERPREIDDIPLAELANASRSLLDYAISLPMDDLCRETAKLFGMSKLTSKSQPYLHQAIQLLEQSGRCALVDGLVKVVS